VACVEKELIHLLSNLGSRPASEHDLYHACSMHFSNSIDFQLYSIFQEDSFSASNITKSRHDTKPCLPDSGTYSSHYIEDLQHLEFILLKDVILVLFGLVSLLVRPDLHFFVQGEHPIGAGGRETVPRTYKSG
jgi:hypothetical protein